MYINANLGIKGVKITTPTKLGAWGSTVNTVMETPVQLRGGNVDAEEIGALTYLGGGGTHLQHIGKIGRFCAIGPEVTRKYI